MVSSTNFGATVHKNQKYLHIYQIILQCINLMVLTSINSIATLGVYTFVNEQMHPALIIWYLIIDHLKMYALLRASSYVFTDQTTCNKTQTIH